MGYLIATQSLIEKINKEVEKEPELFKKNIVDKLDGIEISKEEKSIKKFKNKLDKIYKIETRQISEMEGIVKGLKDKLDAEVVTDKSPDDIKKDLKNELDSKLVGVADDIKNKSDKDIEIFEKLESGMTGLEIIGSLLPPEAVTYYILTVPFINNTQDPFHKGLLTVILLAIGLIFVFLGCLYRYRTENNKYPYEAVRKNLKKQAYLTTTLFAAYYLISIGIFLTINVEQYGPALQAAVPLVIMIGYVYISKYIL